MGHCSSCKQAFSSLGEAEAVATACVNIHVSPSLRMMAPQADGQASLSCGRPDDLVCSAAQAKSRATAYTLSSSSNYKAQ